MIKAVIFDLWYTVLERDFRLAITLRKHFGLGDSSYSTKEYEEAVQLKKWRTVEAMSKNFLKEFKVPVNKKNLNFVVNSFNRIINNARFIPGMKNIIENVHKNYKTGLVSNTTIFESKLICCKLFVSYLFDAEVYSWQIGSLKPNRKMFDVICEILRVKPSECLFVDDTLENVLAARKLGMKGIHFKNAKQLRKEMKTFGVLE